MLLAGGGKTGHFIHGNRLNRYVIFIDLFRFLLSKLVLLLVFIFIILTFLNRVWIYSYKGEDRQPLPFPEYVFKGRSWAPLHLLDRLLYICGNSLLAPRNFALGKLNIHSEPVRVECIVRILLLGLLLWMQELASEAVRTIKVFMVLFAQLGLIVLWDMLLFLQLPAAMSEGTLNSCLLISISNHSMYYGDGWKMLILTLSLNSQYPNTSQFLHISVLYLTTKPEIIWFRCILLLLSVVAPCEQDPVSTVSSQ
jgi:hypothetical protein